MKKLDKETADEWVNVYNQVMQRSQRFSPISSRTLVKIAEYMKIHSVSFLLSYDKVRPSACCSYSIDEELHELTIYDFCVLPVNQSAGASLIDHLLSIARSRRCKRVSTWLPTSSTSSLDVLGEYLFTPGKAMSVMRCFLEESPKDSEIEILDLTTDQEYELTLLPFHVPFQMQSLLESLQSPWKHSYTTTCTDISDDAIDIYLSDKHKLQSWIFHIPANDTAIPTKHLRSTLAYLYDLGVRDILTEVESGDLWQKPFKDIGFERITTRFELYFFINY